ncbi:hypothetical protein FH972_017801 [Carpinus fangiana]|uniref:Uncharacterized protein n=1 Tax=Carpinus fangiana TaxID=176857 RepID=A0A5N6RNF2_9ROSI|nr:hypothetical protein FH972_017801 [Carpinus fangiana]
MFMDTSLLDEDGYEYVRRCKMAIAEELCYCGVFGLISEFFLFFYFFPVRLLTQGVQLYNCLIKSLIGGLASLSLAARIRGYCGVTPITRERGVTPLFETSNIFLVKEKRYLFIS